MHIQQTWHPQSVSMMDLLHAVHYAAVEPETEYTLRSYVAKYHEVPVLTAPSKLFSGRVSGAAYHHGSEFNVYAKGWPEAILHQCTMSEGEREKATLEYLHLQGLGLTVIGFGHAHVKTTDTMPKLIFLGFLGIKS